MFTKAGASETKEGLQIEEAAGRAWAGLRALRNQVTESKAGPWRQVQGVNLGQAAAAHGFRVAGVGGPLELKREKAKHRPQERREEGVGKLKGELTPGPLSRGFLPVF